MAFLDYCRTPFTTHVWRVKAPRCVWVVLTNSQPLLGIIILVPLPMRAILLHVMALAFRHQTSLTLFVRNNLTKKVPIQPI